MPLSSVLGAQSLIKPGVCTSSTRPASPYEGQTIYETDTDTVKSWDGAAWKTIGPTTPVGKVLQVVSTTKTDTYTSASTTFVDITGLTVSITPSSTSSKVLVIASLTGTGQTAGTVGHIRLARGGTAIAVGDAAGNRIQDTGMLQAQDRAQTIAIHTLDSPATTSAITYSVQQRAEAGGVTVYINRATSDTDNTTYGRYSSAITVMEIAA